MGPNLYNKMIYGAYNANYDYYTGNIKINPDSTFVYTRTIPHRNNICVGKWEVISKNKILLNGSDTRKFEGIDSVFFEKLDCKNDTAIFLSNNKIKYKNYKFKKVAQ